MTASNDVNEEHYHMLVDSVRADLEPDADLHTLYAKYGLPADASMSLKTVAEHLYEEISNQFTKLTAADSSLINIKDLKHQLLIRHFCDNIAIEPYLSLLDTIMGATRQSGWELPAPCQSSQAWQAALTAAANYQVISPAGVTNQQGM